MTHHPTRAFAQGDPTNVYFARGTESGLIKVGASCHVPNRLQGIANRLEPMELLGAIRALPALEHELHAFFVDFQEVSKERRGEWYRDNPDVRRVIDAIPMSQRGSVRFERLGDRRPLKYPVTNELFWPTKGFIDGENWR